jgi:hypothetical protein
VVKSLHGSEGFFVEQTLGEKFMLSLAEVSPGGTTKVVKSLHGSEGFFVEQTLGEKFMLSLAEVSPGGTTKSSLKKTGFFIYILF